MALHRRIDVGNCEIPFLQIRRRFAPRSNIVLFRHIGLGLGPPLDPVVGERRMASIFGIASRHVAADAIARGARVRRRKTQSRKTFSVAGKALGAVIRDGLSWLTVRVVASPAPQLAVALAGASASRELLHVADDLEFDTSLTRW